MGGTGAEVHHRAHVEPWGIGFLSWAVDVETVECALTYAPSAVMLSFGDPQPFAAAVHAASARLIVQVTNLEEARRAVDVGADVIVAQGTEAGGHGGMRATFPFVPAVVDLVRPTPVLAAGGIADGRGLAAALALGASGALVGTRFEASDEARVDAASVKAILNGRGEDTERSRVLDIARGSGGRRAIRAGRCAMPSSRHGGIDPTNWPSTPPHWRTTASLRQGATWTWWRCGPARPSISSPSNSAADIVAAMVERAEETLRGLLQGIAPR